MNASSSASERAPGHPPPPTCPICLQSINQEAYLDRCFHLFCYQCIGRWVSYVSSKSSQPVNSIRCPLCKIGNLSIVYDLRGTSFQRQYVNQEVEKRYLSDAHHFRMQVYVSEREHTNGMFNVEKYWNQHRYIKKNNWVQEWLRREVQALSQDKDVDIIVHHINGVAESFFRRQKKDDKATAEQKRKEFRVLLSEAAQPFLFGFTERFIDELELFLASGLNIEAYDKVCMPKMGRLSSGESCADDGELYDQTLLGNSLPYLDEDIEIAK